MEPYLVSCATSLAGETVADIFDRLTRDGWVVIETPRDHDPDKALLDLQAIFGEVVFHPYSKAEGVVVVDNAYRPPRGMTPHTDGTYYPQPPAIMCLQCISAATTGGASTLVDGAKVYDHLTRELPDHLPHLFETVMSVRREDRIVQSPVFWRTGERVRIRFRIDKTIKLEVADRAQRAVQAIDRFINDTENQVIFTLRPWQTLVVDNTRMLHGRTAYDVSEPRKMNRMHLDGKSPRGNLQLGFLPSDAPPTG
jgi:alpha-ketoglutarate-dependent taurine dioxygenase